MRPPRGPAFHGRWDPKVRKQRVADQVVATGDACEPEQMHGVGDRFALQRGAGRGSISAAVFECLGQAPVQELRRGIARPRQMLTAILLTWDLC